MKLGSHGNHGQIPVKAVKAEVKDVWHGGGLESVEHGGRKGP